MTTPLYLLRCKQVGFSFEDLKEIPMQVVSGTFTEHGNDSYDYPLLPSQKEIDLL
ncbi:hypothetical protein O3794_02850 [Gemella sanguinis]|mgnify:CR=1 FL=1|uniref:hypothetical protein n=1 Tax=Gemella sanguinis TaxID=84135 RepID=UPI002060B619|nr:MAG TPA: hypothetical protein [Caudoviricetes sp.]